MQSSKWRMQPEYAGQFARNWGARDAPTYSAPRSITIQPASYHYSQGPSIAEPKNPARSGLVLGAAPTDMQPLQPTDMRGDKPRSYEGLTEREWMIVAAGVVVLYLYSTR